MPASVAMAAEAYSAGYGSFHQIRGSRVLPMPLAALGMGIASWVGTLAGLSAAASVYGRLGGVRLRLDFSIRSGGIVGGAAGRSLAGDLYRVSRARVAGATTGAAVASLIVHMAPPSPWISAAGVVLCAWGRHALFRVS